MFIVDKKTGEETQCVAAAFVNDADLIMEGQEAIKLMQKIINMHNRLHRATMAVEVETRGEEYLKY